MKTRDFDYFLPEELIARYPLKNRTASRLLYLHKDTIRHQTFCSLPDLLNENDLLIFNNTKVIPARLWGRKVTGGKVEILIERIVGDYLAYAHIRANKPLKLPCALFLDNDEKIMVTGRKDSLFQIEYLGNQSLQNLLIQVGEIPLPGYLKRQAEFEDIDRYQTVYASKEGAVAAPTAGLHFDQHLLDNLQKKGIQCGYITLHVGAGTFKPVLVETLTEHKMHSEYVEVSSQVCELINTTKAAGGRVIAVGTTTVRALETVYQNQACLQPYTGETSIFIYPGFRFQCVDAMITNFHIPKSTLLMLVCAFGGYQQVMGAYQSAVDQRYRFYSYGDAMLVIPS